MAAGHEGDADGAAAFLADPDPAVRTTAVGAVIRTGGLVPAVLDAARRDPVAAVRRRACEEAGRALATLADAADGALLEATLAVLRDALGDGDDAVAEAAAWATGEAGARSTGSVPALCAMARHHPAQLCREAAVAALGAIGDPEGLDAVLAATHDRPAVRRRAVVALAAFDDRRADEALRRCTGDRDWQVRQAAEELLGRS